jgi:hypothetical protein
MSQATICQPDHVLTIREAAALIYRTKQPTELQMGRVVERMKAGALRGQKSASRGWATTASCVAEYMAEQACLRQNASRGDSHIRRASLQAGDKRLAATPYAAAEPLQMMYREILKQYFLALIFRRCRRNMTKTFRRSVLAGQVVILVLSVALLGSLMPSACHAVLRRRPPECAAVERWLADNQRAFSVTRWHSVMPAGESQVAVRVEYAYTSEGGKVVDTDRVFTVKDGQVTGVSSSP